MRNVLASSFYDSEALGSACLSVTHINRNKMDYCILGDVQVFVFRHSRAHGSIVVFASKRERSTRGVPPQAFLDRRESLTKEYVERVFIQSEFGSVIISEEKTLISHIQHRNTNNLLCFCLFCVPMVSRRMAPWIQKALKHRKHRYYTGKDTYFSHPTQKHT